jgi:hypothetical protein
MGDGGVELGAHNESDGGEGVGGWEYGLNLCKRGGRAGMGHGDVGGPLADVKKTRKEGDWSWRDAGSPAFFAKSLDVQRLITRPRGSEPRLRKVSGALRASCYRSEESPRTSSAVLTALTT